MTRTASPNDPDNTSKSDTLYWSRKRQKTLTFEEVDQFEAEYEDLVRSMSIDLEHATELAQRANLPVASTLTRLLDRTPAIMTGGYSNTDHTVVWTGHAPTDRLEELKRNMAARFRDENPENKGADRWDKPRTPGGRRRRIVRDADAPEAPPEPPKTGYIVFIGQMTCKIRHNRPNERHNQTQVVQEISKYWRIVLTEHERESYNNFADELVAEYQSQNLEFRATGCFTPSEKYGRVQGVGPWVHKNEAEQNELEKEILSYETVVFPARPPEYDDDYNHNRELANLRRKLKVRGLLNPDGTPKISHDELEQSNEKNDQVNGAKEQEES